MNVHTTLFQTLIVRSLLLVFLVVGCGMADVPRLVSQQNIIDPLENLQREFSEHRFGMFICYNIMSYGARWGEANHSIEEINPQPLDCDQWADAAISAGMTYGLLTTKHHEGFCLWDSATTEYDVAGAPYKQDVVKKFVDAFRKKGLGVGLYYSICDSTHHIGRKALAPDRIEFIKTQLTELLTNYGKIDFLFFDGWYWNTGHNQVSFREIRELIRELQPACLVSDNTHIQGYYRNDYVMFEYPMGAYPPADNQLCSAICDKLVGGNGWFWGEHTPAQKGLDPQKAVKMLKELEERYCTYMLACLPNRNGLLEENQLNLLADIGKLWEPDMERPPLPPQPKHISYSVMPVNAEASSGDASLAIDGRMNGVKYTEWTTDREFPQHITIDLGKSWSGLEALTCVPAHRMKPERSIKEGNVTQYRVSISQDNVSFKIVSEGEWEADARVHTALFDNCVARYVKLEVLGANGDFAQVGEIDIGAWSADPQPAD